MTQSIDVKRVLKVYVIGHDAAQADCDLIERYLALPKVARIELQPELRAFFTHHELVRQNELVTTNLYFFPWLKNLMEDKGEFFRYMREQQKKMNKHCERILKSAYHPEDDAALCTDLRKYIDLARAYIEHHETILIPYILQYYTAELQKVVERDFMKRMGVRGVAHVFPWMLAHVSKTDRDDILGSMPRLFQWLYRYIWEPAYKKNSSVMRFTRAIESKKQSPGTK